ncbi:hypothetical protein [Phocaeicola sp.]
MKKLSLYISILAFIISTITLVRTFPSKLPLGFDYLGILVGILALLTTVLLAWQLINYLSFEDRLNKKIEEAQDVIYKKNKEYMQGIVNYSEAFALMQKINSIENEHANIYRSMFWAIYHFCNYGIDTADNIRESLEAMKLIVSYFEDFEREPNCCCYNSYKLSDFKEFEFNDDDFISCKSNILWFLKENKKTELLKEFKDLEDRRLEVLRKFNKKRIIYEKESGE